MSKLKLIFAGAVLCCAFKTTAVSAMPIAPVATNVATNAQQVRWVCGPYGRCWWRPNYYYGYYGYAYAPRPYYWRHRYWRRHYW
ncbi:MAG TPA: hypothetical protein VKE53_12645 [Pseudolabrys sp.]|nr:hypothetical protein [Pseudolabrys sp.]